MKKKKTKNNLSFYDKNVVRLLEKLGESTDDSSQKFSYWLLNQSIQGQPSLFVDCLVESQRIEPLIFLSEENSKVLNEDLKNESLKIDTKKQDSKSMKGLER